MKLEGGSNRKERLCELRLCDVASGRARLSLPVRALDHRREVTMIRSILSGVLTVVIFQCTVATQGLSLATATLGVSVPERAPQT